jgi:branched-chain amino acid transport system substrate-binding protein
MKRKGFLFLLLGFALALVLAAAGCGKTSGEQGKGAQTGPKEQPIKIGVVGPMGFVQGEHHWLGATMAADEINKAGGIKVGDKMRPVELVKVDTNEMNSVTDAASAVERALTVDKVNFLVGGFRTEAVYPMQEVAMDNKVIFMGCGAADPGLCDRVEKDYNRFKYWFRVTPLNSTLLAKVDFLLLAEAAKALREQLGIQKPKVAHLAEKAAWADPIVAAAEKTIPQMGMELVGTWRPSATATDVTAELNAIKDSGAQIIFATLSGPVGVVVGRQWGELQIPAMPVGIFVEAQKKGWLDATGGKGNYVATINTYARTAITEKTIPFYDGFVQRSGQFPTYNAGTYEAIHILKEAIEKAGTLDADALVKVLESETFLGAAGKIKFDKKHDVTFGPGFTTSVGTQWQDGELVMFWPNGWEGVTYPGAKPYKLAPWVVEKYKK